MDSRAHCIVASISFRRSLAMKNHFVLSISYMLTAAAVLFTALSCSTAAPQSSATIVLSAPSNARSTDTAGITSDGTTTDGATTDGALDGDATTYYYTITMTGSSSTQSLSGTFSATTKSRAVTFDGLTAGEQMTVTAEIHTTGTAESPFNYTDTVYSATGAISTTVTASTKTTTIIENAWTGSASFTVQDGTNAVTLPLSSAIVYVSADSTAATPDGTTSATAYKTLSAAIQATEAKGGSCGYRFYKVLSDLTVSSDDDVLAPTADTYIDLGGKTLSWSTALAAKPLFAPQANLIIANGIITGGTSLLFKKEPVFNTNKTLVLSGVSILNVSYTGALASVIYAHDNAPVFIDNSTVSMCLSSLTTANFGAIYAKNSTLTVTNSRIMYCTGYSSSALSADTCTTALYNVTLKGYYTTALNGPACLNIAGGTISLCDSMIVGYSTTSYTETALATNGAQILIEDSISTATFDLESLSPIPQTALSAVSSTAGTYLVAGIQYGSTINPFASTNALVLGGTDSTAALSISGNSLICGYTYLNSGSLITQTGTFGSAAQDSSTSKDVVTAVTIAFDTKDDTLDEFQLFSSTNNVEPTWYALADTQYVIDGVYAKKTSTLSAN